LTREKKIKDGVDILLEGNGGLILLIEIKENDTLCTAFRDIFVLALLGVGEIVVLIK
jgi:hypothetical protein